MIASKFGRGIRDGARRLWNRPIALHPVSCWSMNLHFSQAVFLFFAAAIAGTLNALAGGGSFISFPALLFVGVPPVQANATNTVALWP